MFLEAGAVLRHEPTDRGHCLRRVAWHAGCGRACSMASAPFRRSRAATSSGSRTARFSAGSRAAARSRTVGVASAASSSAGGSRKSMQNLAHAAGPQARAFAAGDQCRGHQGAGSEDGE